MKKIAPPPNQPRHAQRRFIPPRGTILLRHLLDILDVQLPKTACNETTRSDFRKGKRLTEKTNSLLIAAVTPQIVAVDALPLTRLAPDDLVEHRLRVAVTDWDVLVRLAEPSLRPVADSKWMALPYARLLTIDLAIRTAALRLLGDLGSLDRWFDGEGSGALIRQVLDEIGGTDDDIASRLQVSRTTIGQWTREHTKLNDDHVCAVAAVADGDLAREKPSSKKQVELRRRIRRHQAAWRLAERVRAALAPEVAEDVLGAFVRLTNAFHDSFQRSFAAEQPTAENRQHTLEGIVLEGRQFFFDDVGQRRGRQMRMQIATRERDGRWAGALRFDDLRYIETFAANVGALRLRLPHNLSDGPSPPAIAALLDREDLWDAVPDGLVPTGDGSGAGRPPTPLAAVISASAHAAELRGEDSIALHQRAASLDPTNALLHVLVAQALRFAGRAAEAIPSARRAVTLDPDMPAARLELADDLLSAGSPHEALLVLEPMEAAHAESVEFLYLLGRSALETGDAARAHRVLAAAAAMNPRDADIAASAAEAADALHIATGEKRWRLEANKRWKEANDLGHRRAGPPR